MSWTDERVELLTKLWADGLSGAQCAAQLGGFENCQDGGRCAVLGKVDRLGLPPHGKRIPDPRAAEMRAQRRRERCAAQGGRQSFRYAATPKTPRRAVTFKNMEDRQAHAEEMAARFATETTADLTLEQRAKTVRLMQLTGNTCRFPLGDPAKADFCFCGDTPEAGKPYCASHWRFAHNRAYHRSIEPFKDGAESHG